MGAITNEMLAGEISACEKDTRKYGTPSGGCVVAAIGNTALMAPVHGDPDVIAYRQARRADGDAQQAEEDEADNAERNQALANAFAGIGQTLQRQQYINGLSAQLRSQPAQRVATQPMQYRQQTSPQLQVQQALAQYKARQTILPQRALEQQQVAAQQQPRLNQSVMSSPARKAG
jgi:hypothetical protein